MLRHHQELPADRQPTQTRDPRRHVTHRHVTCRHVTHADTWPTQTRGPRRHVTHADTWPTDTWPTQTRGPHRHVTHVDTWPTQTHDPPRRAPAGAREAVPRQNGPKERGDGLSTQPWSRHTTAPVLPPQECPQCPFTQTPGFPVGQLTAPVHKPLSAKRWTVGSADSLGRGTQSQSSEAAVQGDRSWGPGARSYRRSLKPRVNPLPGVTHSKTRPRPLKPQPFQRSAYKEVLIFTYLF